MKIKKTTFYFALTLMLIAVAGFFLLANQSKNTQDSGAIGNNNGNPQEVVLSMKNYNYYPNTITVKANQPVSISLDESVRGCYRGLVIRDFGISKYLKTPQDTIVFTPTKKGTFRFSCSMGMGTGTLIVK